MPIEPSSLRVVDLRKELSRRGIPTGGKKKELIKRLIKALAKEELTENTASVTASTDNLNGKLQNDLNIAVTVKEKPSEVTNNEQKVESIHEEKLVDKPTEETNEQNIEPLPTKNLTDKPIEITSEQKLELIQYPTEQPISEEPASNTTLIQDITLENPSDVVLNTDMVQIEVVQQPAEELATMNQQLSAESLLEEPQEQLIGKSQEQLAEKQLFEQLIEKPFDQSFNQLMERPIESFIEIPQEELDEHRNVDSIRSREQMVTPPRDDTEIKMNTNIFAYSDGFKNPDTMSFNTDIGVKRKANEELHEEPGNYTTTISLSGNITCTNSTLTSIDKRQKTISTDNDNLKCVF